MILTVQVRATTNFTFLFLDNRYSYSIDTVWGYVMGYCQNQRENLFESKVQRSFPEWIKINGSNGSNNICVKNKSFGSSTVKTMLTR